MGHTRVSLVGRLYEALTGRPWLTVRSMAEEFGPPPAVYFARELAGLTDAQLVAGPQRRAPIAGQLGALAAAVRAFDDVDALDPAEVMELWQALPPQVAPSVGAHRL